MLTHRNMNYSWSYGCPVITLLFLTGLFLVSNSVLIRMSSQHLAEDWNGSLFRSLKLSLVLCTSLLFGILPQNFSSFCLSGLHSSVALHGETARFCIQSRSPVQLVRQGNHWCQGLALFIYPFIEHINNVFLNQEHIEKQM